MAESFIIYNNPFEKDFWEAPYSGMWLPALVFFVSFFAALAVLSKIPAPKTIRYKTFDLIRLALSFVVGIVAARYAMLYSVELL